VYAHYSRDQHVMEDQPAGRKTLKEQKKMHCTNSSVNWVYSYNVFSCNCICNVMYKYIFFQINFEVFQDV